MSYLDSLNLVLFHHLLFISDLIDWWEISVSTFFFRLVHKASFKFIIIRPRGLFVSSSYSTNSLTTLRATEIFVLMHSGIVNGYQLLCDAHTVLEPYRGTAAFSFLLTIVLFHFFFLCVCHS